MKKIYLYIAFASTTMGSFAQVNVQTTPNANIYNENPFIDASGYKSVSNNIGKGIYFPRTDLTTWEFKVSSINPGKFSSYFDGMIVYNTATGSTLADVTKGGKQVTVAPGFYYFYNPNKNAPSGNINDGEWRRLDTTTMANNGLTVEDGAVKLGGSLSQITTLATSNSNTLAITGLQTGNNTPLANANGTGYSQVSDKIVVLDANGILKQVKAAMPKFFYAPAVYLPTYSIDPNTNVATPYTNGAPEIDLYTVYLQQYGGVNTATFRASNASSKLPTLEKVDLEFFITWFDDSVFSDVTLSPDGKLNYKVLVNAIPTSKTFINVVFKVKD